MWWYLSELPQGRNAARVGELFQVRGGSRAALLLRWCGVGGRGPSAVAVPPAPLQVGDTVLDELRGRPREVEGDARLVVAELLERGVLGLHERDRHEVVRGLRARRDALEDDRGLAGGVEEGQLRHGDPQRVPVGPTQGRARHDPPARVVGEPGADALEPGLAVRIGQGRAGGHLGDIGGGVEVVGVGEGRTSRSAGELPVQFGDEVVRYRIENNVAVAVLSEGPASRAEAAHLAREPAYGNIAELGLGVLAAFGVKPVGEILLDEKLGLHIAFGRSDHFGGRVGPAAFSAPEAVIHIDRVYVPETQPGVSAKSVDLVLPGEGRLPLMRDGGYVVDFG